MAFVEWRMQGIQVSHCSCNIGCPCQFNAPPTNNHCRAYMFAQIDKGHFGKVKLDGLRFGGLFAWPGPIHEGNGTALPVIDERADDDQRAAIGAVMSGQETEPGALIMQVFASMLSSVMPAQFKPIHLQIDEKAGTAHVRVPGILEGSAEPIRNPVTGAPHRARLRLPTGFEYDEAEFVLGTAQSSVEPKLDFKATHAHIARVNWSTHGVVR